MNSSHLHMIGDLLRSYSGKLCHYFSSRPDSVRPIILTFAYQNWNLIHAQTIVKEASI